jgi:hypothetical protein
MLQYFPNIRRSIAKWWMLRFFYENVLQKIAERR